MYIKKLHFQLEFVSRIKQFPAITPPKHGVLVGPYIQTPWVNGKLDKTQNRITIVGFTD